MFHAGAGGMTDVGTVHFKEPLCTKLNDPSDRSQTGRSYSNYVWIREKDCENGLAFLPSVNALKTLNPGPPPTCPFI